MQARFASAVLLGFVLIAAAACSGGDDDRIAELEADLEASEEALEREMQAREAAEEEAADAEQRAEEAEKELADAEEDAADAEERADAAEEDAADAADAQQAAEQARRQAQQQQQQLQQELTEAEQAELRARARLFALELDLGDGTAAPANTTPGVSAMATVTWPRDGSLTFKPSGVTHTPGSAAPSVPGGWRSAGFTGLAGTSTALINDTVYLYTNIQRPGSRAFWKRYGLDQDMTDTLAPLAKGSSGQAKTEIQTDTATDPATTTTDVTEITVSGSFDGAGGTFTCDTACATTDLGTGDRATSTEINAHVATHVTFSQGRPTFADPTNWTFEPGSIASPVPLNEDDAYLYFGVWSSIPDDITGTYNFRYIRGGGAKMGSDLARLASLTGSATFRGGAVGKYVTQGQVGGQNAKIGTFTATATLNADFDAGTDQGEISGSITDFREGGSTLTGWQVTLGGASADVAANISDAAATGITVANIGGLVVGGSWGANIYGNDNDGVVELTDTVKYPATKYPPVDLAGVTGWFDAVGPGTGDGPNDVALAGAFGAVCTTGTMCAK